MPDGECVWNASNRRSGVVWSQQLPPKKSFSQQTMFACGETVLNSFFQRGVVLIFQWNSSLAVLRQTVLGTRQYCKLTTKQPPGPQLQAQPEKVASTSLATIGARSSFSGARLAHEFPRSLLVAAIIFPTQNGLKKNHWLSWHSRFKTQCMLTRTWWKSGPKILEVYSEIKQKKDRADKLLPKP